MQVNPYLVFSIFSKKYLSVIKIISSLKSSKARDTFGLNSDFLKTHKEALADPIAHLVNLSINQGTVPSTWKIARVTPVFKAGDKTKSRQKLSTNKYFTYNFQSSRDMGYHKTDRTLK